MNHPIIGKLNVGKVLIPRLMISFQTKDLLTTSVFPSICGKLEVKKLSLVLSLDQSVFQKWS